MQKTPVPHTDAIGKVIAWQAADGPPAGGMANLLRKAAARRRVAVATRVVTRSQWILSRWPNKLGCPALPLAGRQPLSCLPVPAQIASRCPPVRFLIRVKANPSLMRIASFLCCRSYCVLMVVAGHMLFWPQATAAEPNVDKLARAILSNRCFACHGPDDQARQSGLRLDEASGLLREADSGEVPIEPGNARASELFLRITTDDTSLRMPPEDFGAPLTEQETAVIGQWIDAGAELAEHWSFEPPSRPAVPHISDATGRLAPIDAFVQRRLLAEGLSLSHPASPAELLRRLSLDLIGLPPTLAQVDEFERDTSPDAYARQVERLLASPGFGEHWARKWLDLARYADSAGYADDPPRTIWAYRDWVVEAINSNLPIDEFTRKQLAGDLLPNPQQADRIATAFHRNTMTNSEGGTNDEEFRNAAIVDRVNTTMAVWMGVTMGCAQCHTHKYDPFTHAEYFQLFAIYNSTADADRRDESPTLDLMTAAQISRQQDLRERIESLERLLVEPSDGSLAEYLSWQMQVGAPEWSEMKPLSFASKGRSDATLTDQVRVVPSNANLLKDTYTLELALPPGLEELSSIQLETIPVPGLAGTAGLAGNGNFVITHLSAEVAMEPAAIPAARFVRIQIPGEKKILSLAEVQVFARGENIAVQGIARQSSLGFGGLPEWAIDGKTNGDYAANSTTHTEISSNPWWELELPSLTQIDRVVLWNRTDNKLQSRLAGAIVELLDEDRNLIQQAEPIQRPKDSNPIAFEGSLPLAFSAALADYSQTDFPANGVLDEADSTGWAVGGQEKQPHQLTLVLAKPLRWQGQARLKLVIEQQSGYRNHLLGSFRIRASQDARVRDWASLPAHLQQAIRQAPEDRKARTQHELRAFYHRELATSTQELRDQVAELEAELQGMRPATSVPVMRELKPEERRKTFVQIRGNYKSLGEQVEPGTPAVFHPVGADVPNRLDLANWLVDRQNPLTARVWANRVWESLFGRGIVPTSEEFGAQGDLPTHPEMLDWLAVELMENGWDNKDLIRLIVTSQTYRQSSAVDAELLVVDPANALFSRGPSLRLSAEMLRDQALSVAGLLSRKMLGEPVRPPQPNLGLKAAFGGATDWQGSTGEDRYRRGLYTTWRRSNPYPSMAIFDAPSREVCTLRRDSTNTPLQALVTLNDPAFVEAAQGLARRITTMSCNCSGNADAWRLETSFRMVTSRFPHLDEMLALSSLLEQAREHFRDRPEEAMQLATDPIGPLPAGVDRRELASWTAVCNALLNLDETLMKR